jgi:hypothetical protein
MVFLGLAGSSVRSDMFVVPRPQRIFSPVGAAWSDDAAPGRSLDGFGEFVSTDMPDLRALRSLCLGVFALIRFGLLKLT